MNHCRTPHYHHCCSPCCPVRALYTSGLSGSIPTSLGSCGLLTHLYVHLRHVMHKQALVSQVATMGLQQIVHPKHACISAVQHTHHAHSPHTYSLTHSHTSSHIPTHTHTHAHENSNTRCIPSTHVSLQCTTLSPLLLPVLSRQAPVQQSSQRQHSYESRELWIIA